MPELPDVTIYMEALDRRIVGRPVEHVRLLNPFVLRSVEPPLAALEGRAARGASRIGKRLVLGFDDELHLVIHLMIAGRLRWLARGRKPPGRIALLALDFADGTLVLTEAGTTRRASVHLVRGRAALAAFDRGGLDVFAATPAQFARRLRAENHTLKRALTDPRLFDGIGNAYSDEILHAARLSPLMLSAKMDDDAVTRLHDAARATLAAWTDRLRRETGDGFPEKVTAFREGMAVHGRFRQPCPACGAPVQRIRYADNETNYCARCQTGGRLLADRALSRLLGQDWPRSLDEL
ncbi:MAG: formamidopyrimidine-DNA glycosylase [Gemmatimonadota bacterium]|nr:formamidopyrimidine-DNA glycosylase [Gemmatimonadota bacterium]